MEVVHDIAALRDWTRAHRESTRILVPTMGALHAGHLALVDRARAECGSGGDVVVSIFVNPTQFGPDEDLEHYPRPLEDDLAACRERGANLVFAPEADAMYAADRSILVQERQLSRRLCGASRPGHFDGVCTIVSKLFHLVDPDAAVFGEKDYQQLAVIRRLVRDLDFDVDIIGVPTVREPDGLAMSSRNVYLDAEQRAQANVLFRALEAADGSRNAGEALDRASAVIATAPAARLDYLEVVDPDSLSPLPGASAGHARLLVAACFGMTRLIDNRALHLGQLPSGRRT